MENLFNIDSPFNRVMTKVFDMVALNLIFLVCCIPIITVGASCSALHDVIMRIETDKEPYIIRQFLRAFRSNFKQATLIWMILFLAGAILYVDFTYSSNEDVAGVYMQCVFKIMAVLYLFVMMYIFQLQARYNNTIWKNLKNALLIAIRQFPKTILLIMLTIAPTFFAVYGPSVIFQLWIVSIPTIAFSGIAYMQDKIIIKIMGYYEEMVEESE